MCVFVVVFVVGFVCVMKVFVLMCCVVFVMFFVFLFIVVV